MTNAAYHSTRSFYGLNRYDAEEHRIYGNLVFTQDIDRMNRHVLNAGGGFIYEKFSEELYQIPIDRKEVVPGVFAEYTFKPNENLIFMAGLRADFHNLFGTFVTPRMHFKYNFLNHYTLRMSAGKGYRTANILSENIYLLASARPLQWSNDVMQEQAWNYGISFVQNYTLLERNLQLNAEFFRTDFQKQLVVDRETSASNIILSPLDGKSYANSLQFDVRYELIPRLDLVLAYRVNDVKQTIGNELLEKPLISKYKGLINMNYATRLKKWMFDYTVQFNGGGRIPRYSSAITHVADMTSGYYNFSPYTLMNAQVTKYFRNWNIYFGVENLTDFKQMHPVEGYSNPFGEGFDATNVWGPILGRKVYFGLRLSLNYE
jgi:outer membrane receptor for ferrienterochelin and colicin